MRPRSPPCAREAAVAYEAAREAAVAYEAACEAAVAYERAGRCRPETNMEEESGIGKRRESEVAG